MTRMELLHALEAMTSVVYAEFERGGQLLRSNAGFRRLLPGTLSPWHLITHPTLDTLVQRTPDPQGVVHQGLITMGNSQGEMVTLNGTVVVKGDHVKLLAGYNIDEFEASARQLMELNVALGETHRELGRSKRELERREEAIRQLSLTDALTGVGNHRHLDETLAAETVRAQRYTAPLSLVMLDIDHFKRVNDTWGHEAGDRVLQEVGKQLRSLLRQTDTASRMGGEEFVVLMPATALKEAFAGAERIRRALEQRVIENLPPVTASFGVASLLPGESGPALLARADGALYSAKREGRNRVKAAA